MYPGAGPMGGMPPNQPGQHGMGPSPMNSPMQQQRRIDPDQMPSPVSAILFLLFIYFFLKETSERHTATDLVNFVYYSTGFLCSKRLHQGL